MENSSLILPQGRHDPGFEAVDVCFVVCPERVLEKGSESVCIEHEIGKSGSDFKSLGDPPSLGCYNRMPQPGWLEWILISRSSRVWKVKIKVLMDLASGEGFFPG